MEPLFTAPTFQLLAEKDQVYIVVSAANTTLLDFNKLVKDLPWFSLTHFLKLKMALEKADGIPVEIGVHKPRIEVTIASDGMEAKIKLNMKPEELAIASGITGEIVAALQEQGVTFGLLTEVLNGQLQVQREFVIARGLLPVDGEHAKLRYFESSERKPTVQSDGSVDFYTMNFIDQVKQGDWLGEKILPTQGIEGRTVTGTPIPPRHGRDQPFRYDSVSVVECKEGPLIVLRALRDGVVVRENGKISIEDLLVIDGDVGPQTGNLTFTGSVRITGTVLDGYSVKATKDIMIESLYGVGAAQRIESVTGDVYIKGGVFGKQKTIIQAGRNVFMKLANDCTITAAGDIHIGFYAIGCKLEAQNIVLDKRKGRVIGGELRAKVKLVTGFIGNEAERSTVVQIEGFNRAQFKGELDELLRGYKGVLEQSEELKRELDVYDTHFLWREEATDEEKREYFIAVQKHERIKEQLYELELKRQQLLAVLQTKGEGEVAIFQKAYPNTILKIKEIHKQIEKITSGTFYIENRTLMIE